MDYCHFTRGIVVGSPLQCLRRVLLLCTLSFIMDSAAIQAHRYATKPYQVPNTAQKPP